MGEAEEMGRDYFEAFDRKRRKKKVERTAAGK